MAIPTTALALLGLSAFREDRMIARHKAIEEAGSLARNLQERIAADLRRALVPTRAVQEFVSAPLEVEREPLYFYAKRDPTVDACLVDSAGRLIYPKPATEALPVDLEHLSPPQRFELEQARRSLYQKESPGIGIERYDRLLRLQPSRDAEMTARFERTILLQRAGRPREALEDLFALLRDTPDVQSEGGLPLRALIAFNLFKLANHPGVDQPAQKKCLAAAGGIASLLEGETGETLLKMAGTKTSASLPEWVRVRDLHRKGRVLYQELVRASTNQVFVERGFSIISLSLNRFGLIQPESSARWVFGLEADSLRATVLTTLSEAGVPQPFGIGVTLAGKQLLDVGQAEVMASTPMDGAIAITVALKDPIALYAQQRKRTVLFGLMMGLSLVALAGGTIASWVSYGRQQALHEMKDNFLSSVSHEMRAPLSSVRLMAEELRDAPALSPVKRNQYQEFIVRECRRLSALIENLLDFAKHQQGRRRYDFEETEIAPLVRHTVGSMEPLAQERGVELSLNIEAEATIRGDAQALQQVLTNLIDNALKHSPAGSRVSINLRVKDDLTTMEVVDAGPGIPPEDHEKIFEKFYRRGSELRRETQGVGLGLAIVKYVTEAHGGDVEVQSEPGKGSRFTVRIPLHSPTES